MHFSDGENEYSFSRYQNLKSYHASLSCRCVINVNTEPRSKQIKMHINMPALDNLHLSEKLQAIHMKELEK